MNKSPATGGCPQSVKRRTATEVLFSLLLPAALAASAQTNVVTYHYDTSRTGQNISETILTPSNVNQAQFGKLFSQPVDGYVYAQPLYLPGVTIPGKGTHNVVYVATEHDSVYAFDADSNTGANASPLWNVSFINPPLVTTVPNGDLLTDEIVPEVGITGTPVIDPTTGTLYVVAKTKENVPVNGSNYVQRLHALDTTTGAEKFGGPVVLQASVPGNGNGSGGGTLGWNPQWQNQGPGLLLINGVVYIGFGAHGDNGPWHGWVLAYSATTLQQAGAWCSSPNGAAGGVLMSGAGIAAEVDSGGNPRAFVASGKGTYDASLSPNQDYGDSIVRLSLTSGVPAVSDYFTPFNQRSLNNADQDLGSGGVLLLPDQPGSHPHLLVQVGKQGRVYLLDRDQMTINNFHYCDGCFSDPEIVQAIDNAVGGMWSMPAYWNNTVYFWGSSDVLKAYPLNNGLLATTPLSKSVDSYGFPGATPTISANGSMNGIVWSLKSDAYSSGGSSVLRAHDACNLSNMLYSSDQNSSRDNPGGAVKFTLPVVINGKVYVGAQGQVSVYGLLQQAATPTFNPPAGPLQSGQSVAISYTTPNASIFYTLDGSTPTPASTPYTGPITLTSTTPINAIATAPGFLNSAVASATYIVQPLAATPTFSPSPSAGPFPPGWPVTLIDATSGAAIFYTLDGSTPNPSTSTKYTAPFTLPNGKTTVNAIATAPGFLNSAVASATYTVQPLAATPTFSPSPSAGPFAPGQPVTLIDATGGAAIFYTLDGSTPTPASTPYIGPIRLASTTPINAIATAPAFLNSELASATYTILTQTPIPTFSPPAGTYLLSVQVSLSDSLSGVTIYYTIGGSTPNPSLPTTAKYTGPFTVSTTTTVNAIANASGLTNSPMATATYTIQPGASSINFGTGFTAAGLALVGSAALNGTRLRLTDGGSNQAGAAWFATPINVQGFTNDFSFQLTNPNAHGITFTIQGNSSSVLGPAGGGLGYGPDLPGGTGGIGKSVAVKFDLYDNAGEGVNSSGLYTNSVSPTVPFVDLTGMGIDLHSGHVFNVHMVYDGTQLTLTITDATTNASFTTNFNQAIDIPGTVGGPIAYAGFTGGTGGLTAIQEIITWTYASSAPSAHSVTVNWVASTSVVVGYNVYRTTQAGGPYTKLNSSPIGPTSYTDTTAQAGQTYFYVVTGVDANGVESGVSNQAQAVVPYP